jgi:hypothetical protein
VCRAEINCDFILLVYTDDEDVFESDFAITDEEEERAAAAQETSFDDEEMQTRKVENDILFVYYFSFVSRLLDRGAQDEPQLLLRPLEKRHLILQ